MLDSLFSSNGFMPHGHCYLWKPGLIWLHVVSDSLIAMAYISIPFTLFYFVRRRRVLPFHGVFLLFGLFIISCGATHLMEIWTLWTPLYWLSGVIKALTALASVPTAILLIRLVPQALALPSPSQLAKANRELLAARNELEARVVERTAELAEKRRIENDLRISNGELESFSYSVAHDLRAPLRAMSGFSHVLLEDCSKNLPPEGLAHLQRIQQNAAHMSDLIDGLLALARVTRDQIRPAQIDLSALVRATLAQLALEEPARRVEIAVADGVTARIDEVLGRTLLVNLLGNAWKFTGKTAAARIEFGVTEDGDQRTYFVRDNGAGFDMAYTAKLFGVFQRLHGEAFAGTGIGLATCRRIVERHGGRLWAEAQVGRGATFRFTLAETPAVAAED